MKKVILVIFFIYIFFATEALAVVKCPLTTGKAYKYKGNQNIFLVTSKCTKQVFSNSKIFFTYFKSWGEVKTTSKSTINKIINDTIYSVPTKKAVTKVNAPKKSCHLDPSICVSGTACIQGNCKQLSELLPNNTIESNNCKNDEVYIDNVCVKAKSTLVFYSYGISEKEFNKFIDHAVASTILSLDLLKCKNNIRIHKLYNLCIPKNIYATDYLKKNYNSDVHMLIHPWDIFPEQCSTADHAVFPIDADPNILVHELGHGIGGLWDQYCYYPQLYNPPNPVDFIEGKCKALTESVNDIWYKSYCNVTPQSITDAFGQAHTEAIEPFRCLGQPNTTGGVSAMGDVHAAVTNPQFGFSQQEINFVKNKLGCN